MRREILFQIEVQKMQESFVDFKFFARKAGAKAPAQRRAGVFRGDQKVVNCLCTAAATRKRLAPSGPLPVRCWS
jgi:hypothetical protein